MVTLIGKKSYEDRGDGGPDNEGGHAHDDNRASTRLLSHEKKVT